MKPITIKLKRGVRLRKPILVAGMPGIGNVGKLAVEHLRKELKAERIGVIYSKHFMHQVVMLGNGGVRLVSNSLYLVRSKSATGNDILLLTGDQQAATPEGQYELNSRIVDLFKDRLNGSFIYTIGGYNSGNPPKSPPQVFANATGKDVIEKLSGTDVVFGKSRGLIWGSAGLLVAFAKMRKVPAVCLMGETSMLEIDASAAKVVILTLSKILKLDIKTGVLDNMIKETANLLKELERQQAGASPEGQYQSGPEHRPSYIR